MWRPRGVTLIARYASAIVAVAVVVVAQRWLWSFIPPSPFLLFYPAVFLVARFAGLGPALLSTAMVVPSTAYYFLSPLGSFQIHSARDILDLGIFASLSVMISVLVYRQRESKTEAKRSANTVATGILERSTDGFIVLDPQWRYTYVNHQAEQLIGKTRKELLGTTCWESFPPLVGSTWDRQFHRAVEHQMPVHFDEYYSPLDTWFETHAYPSKDGVTIYLRSINERKYAEQALQAKARQQEAIAALGQEALLGGEIAPLLDAAVNTVASALCVELVKVLELLPDKRQLVMRSGIGWKGGIEHRVDAGELSQAGYTLLTREPVVVEDLQRETRFSPPPLLRDHGVVSGMSVAIAGRERPFGILGAHTRKKRTFTEDEVHFLQAIANTLGEAIERKRAQESLVESEARFRQLAESVHEAFFVMDREWEQILYCNPACQQLWGQEHCGLVHAQHWVEIVVPDDRTTVFAMRRATQQGQEQDQEVRVTRDGETRDVRIHVFPLRNDVGDVYRIVGVAEDVTERKAAEEKARRLAAAEGAVRARDETLAIVSHDLRNPLNTIAMSTAFLKSRQTDELCLRQLQVVERGTATMNRLIQDLLDASKIEGGRFAVEVSPLAIGPVVQEACEAFRPSAEQRRIRLECEIDEKVAFVPGDRHRLVQALSNLLGNAIKFTPEDGCILVRAEQQGEHVRISVKDTGLGINREHLPHVFERFFQGGRADRRGAGLGLTIVKGIAEAHGGTVGVDSEPGAGSTFYFTIPIASGAEESEPALLH